MILTNPSVSVICYVVFWSIAAAILFALSS